MAPPTRSSHHNVVSHASLRQTHRRCGSISTSSAAAPPASCRPARSGCAPSSRRTPVRRDASRTRTGHGVRAATRLTLLSSRSSRHSGYSRDSRVTEAVAHDLLRACVDIGEGRRQAPALPSNLRVTCLRSARTAISHLPFTPPGARAAGAAVHTAAAHRRRLVRRAAPRRSSEDPPSSSLPPTASHRPHPSSRAPLQVRAAGAGGRPFLQNEIERETRAARAVRGALQPAARRGAVDEGRRRLRLRLASVRGARKMHILTRGTRADYCTH